MKHLKFIINAIKANGESFSCKSTSFSVFFEGKKRSAKLFNIKHIFVIVSFLYHHINNTFYFTSFLAYIYVASSKCHHPNEMYTSRIVCVYDKIYNLTWVYFSMAVLMLHDSSYVFFSSAFRKRPTKFRFCTLATPPTSWCACVWRKYWLFRFFSELV